MSRSGWIWVGLAVGTAAAIVSPLLGAVAFTLWIWIPRTRARARTNRGDQALVDALAETIDLYAVALVGGHNVATATAQVGRWAPEPLRSALRRCGLETERGRILADALDSVSDELGDVVRPLISVLVANERHGAPVVDTLKVLASEVRHDRRRRAEAAARRLPVLMLFPLVVCVLPAFVLLTVVPVIARALGSTGF